MRAAMHAMAQPEDVLVETPANDMITLPQDIVVNQRTGAKELMNAARIEYRAWDILNPELEQDRQSWDDQMHMPAHGYPGGTHLYMSNGHAVTSETTRWQDPFNTDPDSLPNLEDFTSEQLEVVDRAMEVLPFWKMVVTQLIVNQRPLTEGHYFAIHRALRKWAATRPTHELLAA